MSVDLSKVVTVGDLIEHLQKFDKSTIVVQSTGEGCKFDFMTLDLKDVKISDFSFNIHQDAQERYNNSTEKKSYGLDDKWYSDDNTIKQMNKAIEENNPEHQEWINMSKSMLKDIEDNKDNYFKALMI